jgi:hypothetical protein
MKIIFKASKDRTGLFMNKPEFLITSETGRMILEWCNSGSKLSKSSTQQLSPNLIEATEEEVYNAIQNCNSVAGL